SSPSPAGMVDKNPYPKQGPVVMQVVRSMKGGKVREVEPLPLPPVVRVMVERVPAPIRIQVTVMATEKSPASSVAVEEEALLSTLVAEVAVEPFRSMPTTPLPLIQLYSQSVETVRVVVQEAPEELSDCPPMISS
ncbi:hypothetical protein N9J83_08515, partial [Opitutales bacterium]|nr:hypothetical protein [Opitutales bacterium]